MPLYEFHCGACKKESEILVRSSNWEGTECPHCGSTKLTKKLSVFASASGGSGGNDCAMPQSCGMPAGKKRGHGGGCSCC